MVSQQWLPGLRAGKGWDRRSDTQLGKMQPLSDAVDGANEHSDVDEGFVRRNLLGVAKKSLDLWASVRSCNEDDVQCIGGLSIWGRALLIYTVQRCLSVCRQQGETAWAAQLLCMCVRRDRMDVASVNKR
jgi:hypothetical protein